MTEAIDHRKVLARGVEHGRALRVLRPLLAPAVIAALLLGACSPADGVRDTAATGRGTVIVFNAGSLARPLRAALDTYAALTGVRFQQENAGSLETARKLTELHSIPDVIALADYEVFPRLLMPAYVTWYVAFARNRMVLAYTPRSAFALEMGPQSWHEILQRTGVETGRSDPNLDPNGYRTLLVLQLAERHYAKPGLAAALLRAMPARNVRPKEADLVGLLQAGELDYIWSYESIAQAAGLRYVVLPTAIDLSDPARADEYAWASVRVSGATPRDTITFRGEPIVYALSIPSAAPHPVHAARLVTWLLSDSGRAVLRSARLDVLDDPRLFGMGAPPAIAAVARKH